MKNIEVFAEKFDSIFMEILSHCPGWRASQATPDMLMTTKKTWLKAIIEGGVANEVLIRKAVRKLGKLNEKYLISPQRFVELCIEVEMNDYGLPDFEEAFREASQKCAKRKYQQQLSWSHQVVKVACSRCSHELLCEAEAQSKPKFYREYKSEFEEFKRLLTGVQPQLICEKPDVNLLAYQRYLEQFGEGFANDFKEKCKKVGEIIDPKLGSIVKSDVPNAREIGIAMCMAQLR